MKKSMIKTIFCLAVLNLVSPLAQAAESADDGELSLESLLNLKVTTASKSPERIDEAPATINVITEKQIKERGYEFLDQIMKDLPGVDIQRNHGEWPTVWAQRGLSGSENKRTVIMIDGNIENNLFEGSVLGGAQYSLHNVERIEVISGPASALYGANAFGGIINIITKRGKNINGLQYTKGYGQYNTSFDKVLAGGEKNGIEYSLSGSLWNSSGPIFKDWHPRYTNSYVDNAYSLNGRVTYKNITLGFTRYDRPMGEGLFSNSPVSALPYSLPKYGYNGLEDGTASGGTAMTWVNGERQGLWHSYTQTAYLKGEFDLMSELKLTTRLYQRSTGIAPDSHEIYWDAKGSKWTDSTWAHDSYLGGGEVQLNYKPNDTYDGIAGLVADFSNIEKDYRSAYADVGAGVPIISNRSDLTASQIQNMQNIAGYLQGRYFPKFGEYTALTVGARFDNNNVFGNVFNPRVGFVTKPNKDFAIKALLGTAFRAPTNKENFSTTKTRVANGKLTPERMLSAELGASYLITKSWNIEPSFFYNNYYNLIIGDIPLTDGSNKFQNQNVGTAYVYGLQLNSNLKMMKNLGFFGNFTYQVGKIDNKDNKGLVDMPLIATVKGNVGLDLGLAEFLNLNLILNLVGDRSVFSANPIGKVPGYANVTAALTTEKLFNDRGSLSLVVDNVFDSVYYDTGIRPGAGVASSSTGSTYYPSRIPQLGRNAYVKMNIYF